MTQYDNSDDAGALSGKTIFITGAASALGAALCEVLARCGADIVAGDIDHAGAAQVAARLRELGARAYPIGFDAADPFSAEQAVGDAIENFGRLDVLINNAGSDMALPVSELTPARWQRAIDTNLNGPFLLARHAAAHMRQAGGGHIINVAATAAKRAGPNGSAAHASTWGLLGLSHALHAELGPYNIKVTAVIAGNMRTPFLLERFPGIDPATLQEPRTVAEAIRSVLLLPAGSTVAEITVLPLQERSWP